MNLSLILLLALSIPFAQADVIKGKIFKVIEGTRSSEDMVFMQDGRVVFIDKKDAVLMRSLETAQSSLEITTDDRNTMRAARSSNKMMEAPFTPSILPNKSEVDKMFNRLNSNYQRESQCFNRAHVWANDEFKKNNILTEKIFVFFTASYINRTRFNWWFHVAPLVSYQSGGKVEKAVLDFRYADRPLTIKQWTDMFVYSSRECLVTTKFSDYDVNPQTEDCYQITTNMYYWQPQDIAARDRTEIEMQDFAPGSIQSAFAEAF